jgi:hypothetical protein
MLCASLRDAFDIAKSSSVALYIASAIASRSSKRMRLSGAAGSRDSFCAWRQAHASYAKI